MGDIHKCVFMNHCAPEMWMVEGVCMPAADSCAKFSAMLVQNDAYRTC